VLLIRGRRRKDAVAQCIVGTDRLITRGVRALWLGGAGANQAYNWRLQERNTRDGAAAGATSAATTRRFQRTKR
jgi:hypothetical protein